MKKINISKTISIAVIIMIMISLILLIVSVSLPSSKEKAPLAKQGFVDLSAWDFERDGNVRLDGEWGFFPNQLISPENLRDMTIHPSTWIQVPERWSGADTNSIMSDQGVGTYRLQIHVDPSIELYGLKTVNIKNSNLIYVNGKKVGNSGTPSVNVDENYVSRNVPYVTFFPTKEGYLDLVVQVANLDYYNGGIIQSIYLGTQQQIIGLQFKANLLEAIGISFLLLSGIYYFGIYIKRRHDRSFLYFAIFCIAYAFVIATYNEKIFMKLYPFLPYMWVFRVKEIMVGVCLISIALFIRELGKAYLPQFFIRVVQIFTLCASILALITPTKHYAMLESASLFIYLALTLLVAFNIIRALFRSEYGQLNRSAAIFLLSGFVLIILQFVSTLLYIMSIINNNFVSTFTLLFFLMGIAAMFAEQYSRAYSELEVMSHKLIEADKIKDEFLINTSHEFKTPLHGIINLAQVLIDQHNYNNKDKHGENLAYIISLATRLSTLVNDIIDFQSLQNRNLAFHNKTFDINGTIQATIEVLKYMRKSDEIQLINHVPVGKYFLFTDENRFKQILGNLVSNALKYTEKGSVEIIADSREGFVYITVTDSGLGMSDEIQMQLFTENHITSKSQNTEYHSSGLGLKISKLLAAHMGGDLNLKWSIPDKGSSFELVLPKADDQQQTALIESSETIKQSKLDKENDISEAPEVSVQRNITNLLQTNKTKILIVDDEVSNIKVLQELLVAEHYETYVAYNGVGALELLQEHRDITLVLLDVMMPGMSGYEVCKQIRTEYPIYQLPILLLTVRYSAADITTGLEAGANDYLVKPFDSKELMARVKTLLQLKEAVENAIKVESLFLQSQINPHFIYNVLSIIMSLCYSDGERAGKLLGEFSNYLRLSFDLDPYHSKVSLKRELSLVKSYISLEKARFGERLQVEIDVIDDVMEVPVPALIIQPIVENAIRHGLMKRISGGTVVIKVISDEDGHQITVQDDGVGISAERLATIMEIDQPVGNVGLKNVHKRLINEYGNGLLIESHEGVGTKVTITIPYRMRKIKQVGELQR